MESIRVESPILWSHCELYVLCVLFEIVDIANINILLHLPRIRLKTLIMQKKFLFCLFYIFCSIKIGIAQTTVICERLSLFNEIKKDVAAEYWPEFGRDTNQSPLIYVTDSFSYVFNSDPEFLKDSVVSAIKCGEKNLKKIRNVDARPFVMENRMSFSDRNSPFFYNPVMMCSSVEIMLKNIPDFTTSEEWSQLVLHEYFHSFQFRNKAVIDYLADTIKFSADTLTYFYLNDSVFKNSLREENRFLLAAIRTNSIDSAGYYYKKFIEERALRRTYFRLKYEYDITTYENFWEKIEGTARYVEYYCGDIFYQYSKSKMKITDPLFKNFSAFNKKNFSEGKHFKEREEMMAYYFYVTGFNLCRLMDKLKIEYKSVLFKNGGVALTDLMPR